MAKTNLSREERNFLSESVRSLQKGWDETIVSDIYNVVSPHLYRFCVHLCKRSDMASDLWHDSFVKAIENIKKLDQPDRFLEWLFTTCRNHYLDLLRSPKNKGHVDFSSLKAENEESLRQDARQDSQLVLNDLLDVLDPEDRSLIILVYLEDYSYSEVAEMTGVSFDAISSRIKRAKEKLRESKIIDQMAARKSSYK